MQSIVYTGPSPQVETADGTVFPLGQAVDVDDDLAASLLNQSCFLSAADYAAQQASGSNSVPVSDVTAPSDPTITTVPITDPTPDN